MDEIKQLVDTAKKEIDNAEDLQQLNLIRVKYLGKKGLITSQMKKLKDLSQQERPKFGAVVNKAKSEVEDYLNNRMNELYRIEKQKKYEKLRVDVTLSGARKDRGHLHILTKIQKELEDIFISMGFEVVEGPEVEDTWHNFDALNTPEWHPARDVQDSFYFTDKILLRTHTSPVQVRTMLERKPPLAIISPGRVFRRDYDSTHLPMFTQMEVLYVDKNVTVKHLKYTLEEMARKVFGDSAKVRLKPSFFPFTEPSYEVDILFNGKWLEILGAGMVDPNVFKNVGYDPNEWSGFAFGLGLERIAMVKYGIRDIRDFIKNDVRFLENY
ncbi:phenylalanyl-tRNA synthetase subunit alpha [Thermosipho africanus H17ap60334]|jgi:phenylalanyl-tRNA synthetase alpha chain|uniref:Phenylalanine--tRNA ligase alpha subunit n=1 Tax=Thermosipho africanus (strain TCF52B) TaxID=484019 RepID=B7ICP5_THEAB|nr:MULTISPECIES: phenylalanine--tRNA ligase subunit alpha [Thermosipho]ACJ75772.1 phenylalanyl-tRNA synthetase, alpha subunit [Thermosipho africanus TCF52B]EKF49789.1 phenylalanyl-tRNA synthetase subunit alpha [Thermosipho africanus H17ap60334]MBZ4651075.1 pheS [Thermosipho sp. (in: thermotogales)]MDK2900032.1 phenylalanyl-tRNA synthetase alpha chain [Thermosipho sp. (in: thermotogales)]